MSLQVVLTQVEAVRSLNSMDPGIFSNLILASRFRKITATEQKFPSVSTAKGTTTEDGANTKNFKHVNLVVDKSRLHL